MIPGVPPELEAVLDEFKDDLVSVGVPDIQAIKLAADIACAMFRIREIISDRMSGEIRALRAALEGVLDAPHDRTSAAWRMAETILGRNKQSNTEPSN